MAVIPFYGADHPELFSIERAAMDPDRLVMRRLDQLLPMGRLVDIGAGDGFMADGLARRNRHIVRVEPSAGMRAQGGRGLWVSGDAACLPFADGVCDGAYATWAYFFPSFHDVGEGLREVERVVRPGGRVCIVDNRGDDELSDFTRVATGADVGFWRDEGFSIEELETEFRFSSPDDATRLLSAYARRPVDDPPTSLNFRVALMTRTVRR